MTRFKVRKNRSYFFLIVGFILVLFTNSFLFSQQVEVSEEEKAEKLKLQQEILRYKELELKLLEEAFEGTIDPESYIVGPGDYYSVVIWGDIEKGFHLPVTPEGMLIVPTVGQLKVDGLSLKEMQQVVKEAAMKKYKQTKISTNLMIMRKLRVYVTGEVFDPNTYIATPMDRVSDLIYRAGGLKQYADLQYVVLEHKDGTEDKINFSLFKEKGTLSQNPYVQGGDVLVIPQIDYTKSVVRVEGFINNPGLYPLIPRESIIDFLNRHNLLDSNQKLKQIHLYRQDQDLEIVDLTITEGSQTILQNGDKVVLPLEVSQVYVTGAVLKPGMYDYVENLKAKDYVGQAGVNENASGLNKIKVEHASNGNIEKGKNATVYPGDVIEVPIRTSKRISEYLLIASQLATLVIAYAATQK